MLQTTSAANAKLIKKPFAAGYRTDQALATVVVPSGTDHGWHLDMAARYSALRYQTTKTPGKGFDDMPVSAARRRKSRASVLNATDRRASILEAATRRFAEHGYAATTVRQIGEDVNILSGSLYHHFTTKEQMLHEIVRDAVQQLRRNALRIAQASIDAERRLIALIVLHVTELTRHQKAHAILVNERRLFRQSAEFEYVMKAKRDAYRAWQRVLQDGIGAGLFRADTDIFLTILTVLRMLNNAADWFRNDEAHGFYDGTVISYKLDKVIDFHLSFVLNAIRPPARESEPIPRAECEELAETRV
jgi:TetR/AcrR family transcriptional regulator, cholesterol catabolism regulator